MPSASPAAAAAAATSGGVAARVKYAIRFSFWLDQSEKQASKLLPRRGASGASSSDDCFAHVSRVARDLAFHNGVSAIDFVQMYMFIQRYQRACCASAAPTDRILHGVDLMLAACYVSQAIQYDQPLHKSIFTKFHSLAQVPRIPDAMRWTAFLDDVVAFSLMVDWDYSVPIAEFKLGLKTLGSILDVGSTSTPSPGGAPDTHVSAQAS